MKKLFLSVGIVPLLLLGCQNNDGTAQQDNSQSSTTASTKTIETQPVLNIDDVIKVNEVDFRRTKGHYPLFVDSVYRDINVDIQTVVDELLVFDKNFSEDMVEGVESLEYSVLNFDNDALSFNIQFNTQDMTTRYFAKYYQIDLKNKKQILLKNYLSESNVDIEKLNIAFNEYVKPCVVDNPVPDYCHNPPLMQFLGGYDLNENHINIIDHHDSFYVQDKDNVVIAFNSTKYTVDFMINIKEYKVKVN